MAPFMDQTKDIPLGRVGTSNELAEAILLLMGNPYITGITIDVNDNTR